MAEKSKNSSARISLKFTDHQYKLLKIVSKSYGMTIKGFIKYAISRKVNKDMAELHQIQGKSSCE